MEKLATFIIITVLLSSCGPTLEEREEIAIIACNIIGESRNMDAAMRIREINTARDEIGEAAFLETDETIREAIQYDLCGELVMNDPEYTSKLNDLKRLAEQVRSEIPKARFMELVLAITPYKYAMELAAKGDAGDEYAAIEAELWPGLVDLKVTLSPSSIFNIAGSKTITPSAPVFNILTS